MPSLYATFCGPAAAHPQPDILLSPQPGFAWCGAANAGTYCGSNLFELMIYSAAHCNTAIESQNSNLNTQHIQMYS